MTRTVAAPGQPHQPLYLSTRPQSPCRRRGAV